MFTDAEKTKIGHETVGMSNRQIQDYLTTNGHKVAIKAVKAWRRDFGANAQESNGHVSLTIPEADVKRLALDALSEKIGDQAKASALLSDEVISRDGLKRLAAVRAVKLLGMA